MSKLPVGGQDLATGNLRMCFHAEETAVSSLSPYTYAYVSELPRGVGIKTPDVSPKEVCLSTVGTAEDLLKIN